MAASHVLTGEKNGAASGLSGMHLQEKTVVPEDSSDDGAVSGVEVEGLEGDSELREESGAAADEQKETGVALTDAYIQTHMNEDDLPLVGRSGEGGSEGTKTGAVSEGSLEDGEISEAVAEVDAGAAPFAEGATNMGVCAEVVAALAGASPVSPDAPEKFYAACSTPKAASIRASPFSPGDVSPISMPATPPAAWKQASSSSDGNVGSSPSHSCRRSHSRRNHAAAVALKTRHLIPKVGVWEDTEQEAAAAVSVKDAGCLTASEHLDDHQRQLSGPERGETPGFFKRSHSGSSSVGAPSGCLKRRTSSSSRESYSAMRSRHHRRRRTHSRRPSCRMSRTKKETPRKEQTRNGTQAKSPLWQREIYVGNVPANIDADAVRRAFQDLFEMLPEFHEEYPASVRPACICCQVRHDTSNTINKFVFLEFADAVLASTAVAMTGLKVNGHSVRVGRPTRIAASENSFTSGLDVQILRMAGKLPWWQADGATMLDEVWVGGEKRGLCSNPHDVKAAITKALRSIPSVRQRFPESDELVISVTLNDQGKYCFVIVANEVIASTLVALREVEIYGSRLRIGWASSAKDPDVRAPPSLELPHVTIFQDHSIEPCSTWTSTDNSQHQCEVYVGNMKGLDAGLLWEAFNKLFRSLPSFRASYPGGQEPVVKVRAGRKDYFNFVLMRDPVLASTAVKIRHMEVADRKVFLGRPAKFRPPPEGSQCLEIPPEIIHVESDSSSSSESSGPSETINKRVQSLPTPVRAAKSRRMVSPVAPSPMPPPPPPPVKPAAKLWIGNLPRCGADDRLLEAFLTHQALEAPAFDAEDGPPVQRVTINYRKRFAFVEIRDFQLAEQLLPIYSSVPYFGCYLHVDFCRPRRRYSCPWPNAWVHQQIQNGAAMELKWNPSQTGNNEEEFHDLGAAVANLDMGDL